jgi:hypothetical protein
MFPCHKSMAEMNFGRPQFEFHATCLAGRPVARSASTTGVTNKRSGGEARTLNLAGVLSTTSPSGTIREHSL